MSRTALLQCVSGAGRHAQSSSKSLSTGWQGCCSCPPGAAPSCALFSLVCLHSFLHASDGPGGGVIQGSAGESAIVVLLAAVARTLKADPSLHREDMEIICSDQVYRPQL